MASLLFCAAGIVAAVAPVARGGASAADPVLVAALVVGGVTTGLLGRRSRSMSA